MREKSACLNGKFEVLRRSVAPTSQGFDFRQHVKAVVDLHRIETLVVVGQHLRRGKLLWIEFSHPVLVMPSRSSDADVGHGVLCRTRGHLGGDARRRKWVPEKVPCSAKIAEREGRIRSAESTEVHLPVTTRFHELTFCP